MRISETFSGLASALSAYLIWGFVPVYFKLLKAVPPLEILMHRMVWSCFLLLALIFVFGRAGSLFRTIKNRRTLSILLGTTLLVGFNWFTFIWAINNDRILDASLGYFICPLVSILLAALILRERLRRLQWAAVALAACGVLFLTIYLGQFPWVAMALAISFAFYGLIRKTAPVEALEGLTVETLLMSLPAIAFLLWQDQRGLGSFLHAGTRIDLLLVGTALPTAIPLLLFNLGARRLNLATIGFMQYIAPSCTFLLAVFIYNEPFSVAQAATFGAIWTGLGFYSTDAVLHYRAVHRLSA